MFPELDRKTPLPAACTLPEPTQICGYQVGTRVSGAAQETGKALQGGPFPPVHPRGQQAGACKTPKGEIEANSICINAFPVNQQAPLRAGLMENELKTHGRTASSAVGMGLS